MCTKPCSGPMISRSTKWMTGFILYPTIDTEHYQLMILNVFLNKQIIKRDKILLIQRKCHWQYFVYFLISEYVSFNQQIHARDRWNENVIDGFSQFFESIYLKYLEPLQYERKYEISISNKIWQHVFRSGSRMIYFHIFVFSVTYLVYIFFFLYVVIIHLLRREGGAGIYCRLIPD